MTVKYIIGHWTAGGNTPSAFEKKHYQCLVDNTGRTFNGSPVGTVASTGGMNSITYNIAVCGGLASTPVTAEQMEAFCKKVAEKLRDYNLSVDKFYTHAEIGEMVRNYQNKIKKISLKNADCKGKVITDLLPYNGYLYQNIGKVDLRKLPDSSKKTVNMTAYDSGNYLRGKIRWYLSKL